MAKGYWIGRVDVSNEEGYKPYSAANAAIFRKYGGRFVVRAGKFEAVEGAVLRMIGLVERRGFRIRKVAMSEQPCGRRGSLALLVAPADPGRSVDVLARQLGGETASAAERPPEHASVAAAN